MRGLRAMRGGRRARRPRGRRAAAALGLAGFLLAGSGAADTFTVTTSDDSGPGSLRQAIVDANESQGADRIVFAPAVGDIVLASSLPSIVGDLEIDGDGAAVTVDGNGAHRVFFVSSGVVRLSQLGVVAGLATGGDGAGRGGGGLGAGGGLFVDEAASVVLDRVDFDGHTARGGDAGDGVAVGGGGGGLAGAGGANAPGGGGGGGGGFTLTGDDSDGGAGGPLAGGDGGGLLGGAGGGLLLPGEDGGPLGGGGGGGPDGAGGGDGGAFGGGGGATGTAAGGDGGYGGGGGGGAAGGGQAGFGGGDGGSDGRGDGGSALGGAIFVRAGGSLRILDSSLGAAIANAVTPGAGENAGGAGGQDLYLDQGVDVEVDVAEGGSESFEGSLSGAGALTKNGDGELDLQGGNDYSGGTRVLAGTLRGDAESLQGEIQNDSELVFSQEVNGSFQGSISGAGSVTKEGNGTLVLDGANSYSGGTVVESGVLDGDAAAVQGDVDIQSGATLRFDQSGTGTHTGILSGAGDVVKRGDGTLVLRGLNSYSGGTTIEAGVLQGDTGSLQGAIATQPDTGVVFDQASSGSFDGAVSGAGSLAKRGAGALGITGPQSFTGGTTVEGGRLDLSGQLVSDVVVEAAGAIGGTGRVAAGLEVRGTAAPGFSVGTLQADSLVFAAGSTFEVEIDPVPEPASSDRLEVAGTAMLEGGTVRISLLDALPEGETRTATILEASSIVGPGFAEFEDDLAFVDVEPMEFPTQIALVLSGTGAAFSDFAETANQQAVAAALDALEPTEGSDLEVVFDNLFTLSEDELRRAFDEIGGEALTAFTTARLVNGLEFARVVERRMATVGGRAIGGPGGVDFSGRPGRLPDLLASRDPADAVRLAAAGAAVSLPAERARRFGAWVDGYGIRGDLDGDAGASGTDWWGAGGVAGFDLALGHRGLVGLTGGYARLDVDVESRPLDGDADVFQGALYGSWVGERLHLAGLARYAYSDVDAKRRIRFADIDRTARADFGGHEAGALLGAGYVVFAPAGVQLEPLASLHYTWIQRDSIRESGADSLDLDAASESWNSLISTLGLRMHRRFEMGEQLRFVPELFAGWSRQWGDRDRRLDASLAGAPYRVAGATLARDGASFGAGWRVSRGGGLSFLLYYDGGWNPDLLLHAVSGGLLIRW